jgi:hypothetical protein
MAKSIIPKGNKVEFEDDIVSVYDAKGIKVYHGILDYCPFKDDFDDHGVWDANNNRYKLPNDYVLVCWARIKQR